MILENCRNQVQIDRGIGHIKVTKKQNFLLKRLQKNIQIVKKNHTKKICTEELQKLSADSSTSR